MEGLVGRTLGPYTITHRLGAGGMATIYRARHSLMDRDVALKILPERLAADQSTRARFSREVRAIAKLEHRAIVPVYDVGEHEGIVFMAMRYIDGGTLAERLERGPLPIDQALEIVAEVGEALEYAHSKGIIHRDIKPANILIDNHGQALLSDFGIAKLVADSTMNLTGEGMLLGTPFYMAPEQVQGQPVDQRTDIYALGVVLYEVLTGTRPYVSDTPLSVALMHINAPLPAPRQVNPAIPVAIEQVLLKAMSKDPATRYQMASELVAALRRAKQLSAAPPTVFVGPREDATIVGLQQTFPQPDYQQRSGPPTPQPFPQPDHQQHGGAATPQPFPQPVINPAGGRPNLMLIGGVVALVLLAGGFGIFQAVSGNNEGPDRPPATVVANTRVAPTVPVVAVGTESSPAATVNTATGGTPTEEPVALGVVTPTAEPAPVEPAFKGDQVWIYDAPGKLSKVPSADENSGLIIVSGENGMVYGVNLDDGTLRWEARAGERNFATPLIHNGRVFMGSFNPNGGSGFYAFNAEDGTQIWSFETPTGFWATPAMYTDRVIFASDEPMVYGALDGATRNDPASYWTFKPDYNVTNSPVIFNEWLFIGTDRYLYVLDPATGYELWKFDVGSPIRSAPAVEETFAVFGSDKGTVYALNPVTQEVLWEFKAKNSVQGQPALDDAAVYITSFDNHVYALDRENGRELWSYNAGDKISTSPLLHEGVLYVGNDANTLLALDAATGRVLWAYPAADNVGGPIRVGGRLYMVSGAQLIAIE